MRSLEHRSPLAALEAIVALADETRATAIAADARRAVLHRRQLCLRLRQHLYEHQLALLRSAAEHEMRIKALSIARALAESVLELRTPRVDDARTVLGAWLRVERTKFLMSHKADAMLALQDRLARPQPRHQLGRLAVTAVHEIAGELVAGFSLRTGAEVMRPLAVHATQLLLDLELSLGDLGETPSLVGLDLRPPCAPARAHAWPLPSLADRFGLASRSRIEAAARDALVAALEERSRTVALNALADFDDTRVAIERRFCALTDGMLESARVAAEFARHAQAGGADDVARARCRIAGWVAMLDDIMQRLA